VLAPRNASYGHGVIDKPAGKKTLRTVSTITKVGGIWTEVRFLEASLGQKVSTSIGLSPKCVRGKMANQNDRSIRR